MIQVSAKLVWAIFGLIIAILLFSLLLSIFVPFFAGVWKFFGVVAIIYVIAALFYSDNIF